MAERYTLPGTRLPEGTLPPTLLFHRWQAYDRFQQEGASKAFKRDACSHRFLQLVAARAHDASRARYAAWHERFADACAAVGAEPPLPATTLWRMVVGWGTNPTFETGLTLDHLLGFPFIPGSAVKGLLHRVAEQELLEAPAIPEAPASLPTEPPSDLIAALTRSLRVHALFGSLHLRRGQSTDPEAPFDRLVAWRNLVQEAGKEPPPAWANAFRSLERLCSEAPAGGMVTCFDAVPTPKALTELGSLLTPDVLTPHVGDGPNPILFLAVRDGVTFELRYRLSRWPAAEPRDQEEQARSESLAGIDRPTVAAELKRWLTRGLEELGLGGKTSAGYGYLLAQGSRIAVPELLTEPPLPPEPKEEVSDAERIARSFLPPGIPADTAVDALDKALKEPDETTREAVAARFVKLFPDTLAKWRTSQRPATKKRVETIDRLLASNKESGS